MSPAYQLPSQEEDIEELASRRSRPWREHVLNLSQLTSYINILTGRGDIHVFRGSGEAHVGTGDVWLPVGTLEAGETAAHEAGHIDDKGAADAWRHCYYQGKAWEMVLEFLRDGYIEYHMGIEHPGLHVQWQYVNDDSSADLLTTEWIPQALIGIYLTVAGYTFPEDSLKPKAKKLLAEFRALKYDQDARIVSANDCAKDLVPKVIALFNVPTPPPGGSGQGQPPTGCGQGQPNPNGSQQGQGQGQGQGGQSGQSPKGQDVNSLLNNATRTANKVQKFENAKNERAEEADFDEGPGGFRPVPKGNEGGGKDVRSNVPKPLRDIGDAKDGEKQQISGKELQGIFGGGRGGDGIGYNVDLAHMITIVDRSRG